MDESRRDAMVAKEVVMEEEGVESLTMIGGILNLAPETTDDHQEVELPVRDISEVVAVSIYSSLIKNLSLSMSFDVSPQEIKQRHLDAKKVIPTSLFIILHFKNSYLTTGEEIKEESQSQQEMW
jgi:hypothetical protein